MVNSHTAQNTVANNSEKKYSFPDSSKHIKRMGEVKVPFWDNPVLNKIGPTCTPWIIFCTRVLLYASICPRIRKRPFLLEWCVCAHKPEHIIVCFWYKIISSWASSLPGLWSVTQIVVKTAALRRAGVYRGDKYTCGHVEPQEQDEEHFGPLLRIRSLTTCAPFAPTEVKQTCFFSHLHEYHPHGFVPPLRCPIVMRLLWVPR